MQGLKAGIHFNFNGQSNEIEFFNGSKILLKDLFLYPSDPNFDELGSLEITGAFVDECNQVAKKAWNILQSRIRYKLDEYELTPKILGTCNPSKNWVYSDFYKKDRDGKLEDSKVFIKALATDNPFISPHYISNLHKLDNNSKQRLLYGNWEFDDDPAKLYELDEISDLFTNKAAPSEDKYISVDVARFGADKTVITLWRGLKGKVSWHVKKSTSEVAQLVIDLADREQVRRSRIIIDEDGVGGGVLDQIPGARGFLNGSSPIQLFESTYDNTLKRNYGNLKAQCAFKLQELMKKGIIEIECDDEVRELLSEEMEFIKEKNVDKDGKIYLVGKDKIKEELGRSPDFFDSILMRMFFELQQEIDIELIEF